MHSKQEISLRHHDALNINALGQLTTICLVSHFVPCHHFIPLNALQSLNQPTKLAGPRAKQSGAPWPLLLEGKSMLQQGLSICLYASICD